MSTITLHRQETEVRVTGGKIVEYLILDEIHNICGWVIFHANKHEDVDLKIDGKIVLPDDIRRQLPYIDEHLQDTAQVKFRTGKYRDCIFCIDDPIRGIPGNYYIPQSIRDAVGRDAKSKAELYVVAVKDSIYILPKAEVNSVVNEMLSGVKFEDFEPAKRVKGPDGRWYQTYWLYSNITRHGKTRRVGLNIGFDSDKKNPHLKLMAYMSMDLFTQLDVIKSQRVRDKIKQIEETEKS